MATIALVQHSVFGHHPEPNVRPGICLVLGSSNCEYRIAKAYSLDRDDAPDYVLCGGGRMANGDTEASFMRSCLLGWGVRPERIFCDEESACTFENLQHARRLIELLAEPSGRIEVTLITGGFHLRRALEHARRVFASDGRIRLWPMPAHGPNTGPDTWSRSETGRRIIADELEKIGGLGLLSESK